MNAERPYRGSRKHVLDWVETAGFVDELCALLAPLPLVIPRPAVYMPKGRDAPEEAQLHSAPSAFAVLDPVRDMLQRWWLRYPRGARTPNWDLLVACEIAGRPGLALVEAKANYAELKTDGVSPAAENSQNSLENRKQIAAAIGEAREGLRRIGIESSISAESHYQLANRIAFLWKLASLGIPTVLVYLGFTGDGGIVDAGAPFAGPEDWQSAFAVYSAKLAPAAMLEQEISIEGTPAWMLVRSRPVLTISPPRWAGS